MVRVHGYNPERKSKGFLDLYLMAVVIAIVGAVVLIAAGLSIKFLVLKIIQYWIWVLVVLGALVVIRHFIKRRK